MLGDLNYNLLYHHRHAKTLSEINDIFDMSCLLSNPTCFKGYQGTLLDVFLTNRPKKLYKSTSVETGISDFHHIIITVMKGSNQKPSQKYLTSRSYKKNDETKFLHDLNNDLATVDITLSDYEKNCSTLSDNINNVIDCHAPIKTRKIRNHSSPAMNREWRRAIYKKNMLKNNFFKFKSQSYWEAYRKQRNYCSRLKKISIKEFFGEYCDWGTKSQNFWKTIKPFLSKKSGSGDTDIILLENDKVITDEGNVCEMLNDYYVNIARNIGIENEENDIAQHQDVEYIANNHPQDTFQFDVVDKVQVYKKLKEINPKKATGPDDIPPNLVKLGSRILAPIIIMVIKYGITTSNFPSSSLKMANVSPVFKKNDNMSQGNYRPVSVLPTISKTFQSILADQLSNFLETVYNAFTSAFRKHHSCQSVLIRIIEDWKQAHGQKKYVGAILMNLSKAFDCQPHKLKAYGLTDHSMNLLRDYLSNRKQRVKIGNNCSECQNITKGVPQASILGPILFNIFLKDIFASLNETTLYNYAKLMRILKMSRHTL